MKKELSPEKIILYGFYLNIIRQLWKDVEEKRIPLIILYGIAQDIRIILYGRS